MLDAFLALARSQPAHLRTKIRERAYGPQEMTYALEALGVTDDADAALDLLLIALDDADPRVREGAVHGLAHFINVPTVRDWLAKIGATDASDDVRAAVEDVL